MKNREERPPNLDRGATQQTFDFGNEVEPTLPANFLRPEVTDPAFGATPSLYPSISKDQSSKMPDRPTKLLHPFDAFHITVCGAWGDRESFC